MSTSDIIVQEGSWKYRVTLKPIAPGHELVAWALITVEEPAVGSPEWNERVKDTYPLPKWGTIFKRHTGRMHHLEINEHRPISPELFKEACRIFQ